MGRRKKKMFTCLLPNLTLKLASTTELVSLSSRNRIGNSHSLTRTSQSSPLLRLRTQSSPQSLRFSRRQEKPTKAAMAAPQSVDAAPGTTSSDPPMKLLFVEMGVGYDQHGQDINSAAMRACRDAITSNSIPAFRRGSIPGVTFEQMKLQIKLGVPHSLQQFLDVEKIKSVFPYGKILNVEVVDGGLICSSGVLVEEMGDKNDDCYIVNAAVYIGY